MKSATRSRPQIYVPLFALLAIGLIYVWSLFSSDLASQQRADTPATTVVVPPPEVVMPVPAQTRRAMPAAPENTEQEQLVSQLVHRLQSEFAARIHDVAFQVSLKDMRDGLLVEFPQTGFALFEQIIRQAFPELADTILANIALMDRYDDWLLDNVVALNDMDLLSQQGALWEKRRELFGADADRIWREELNAKAERQAAVQRSVQLLNTSYDTDMYERAFLLKSAFEEGLAGTPQEAVLDSKGVMAQVFFGFDAVQKELEAMPPEARQEEINTIRRHLGFDEQSIAELAAEDAIKNKRWENGKAYMAAREQLMAQYNGQAPEKALDELRTKFFGNEAFTIKREEEDLGFFRYTRPRVYGRN
ncbi:MAG: hypothetical protein R3183_04445 [Oleiphilaceae bacterium]|nr:hypothetical protein [Oleiphilaceae bacterium]